MIHNGTHDGEGRRSKQELAQLYDVVVPWRDLQRSVLRIVNTCANHDLHPNQSSCPEER